MNRILKMVLVITLAFGIGVFNEKINAVEINNAINKVEVNHLDGGNDMFYHQLDLDMLVSVSFATKGVKNGDTLSFNMPSELELQNDTTSNVVANGNRIIGKVEYKAATKQVKITFSNLMHDVVSGKVNFKTRLNYNVSKVERILNLRFEHSNPKKIILVPIRAGKSYPPYNTSTISSDKKIKLTYIIAGGSATEKKSTSEFVVSKKDGHEIDYSAGIKVYQLYLDEGGNEIKQRQLIPSSQYKIVNRDPEIYGVETTNLRGKLLLECVSKVNKTNFVKYKYTILHSSTNSNNETGYHGQFMYAYATNMTAIAQTPLTKTVKQDNIVYHYKVANNAWFNEKIVITKSNKITALYYSYDRTKHKSIKAVPNNLARLRKKEVKELKYKKVVKIKTMTYNNKIKPLTYRVKQLVKKKYVQTYMQAHLYFANNKVKEKVIIKKSTKNKFTAKKKMKYTKKGFKKQYINLSFKDSNTRLRQEIIYTNKGDLKSSNKSKAYYYRTTYLKGKVQTTYQSIYSSSAKKKKATRVKLRKFF